MFSRKSREGGIVRAHLRRAHVTIFLRQNHLSQHRLVAILTARHWRRCFLVCCDHRGRCRCWTFSLFNRVISAENVAPASRLTRRTTVCIWQWVIRAENHTFSPPLLLLGLLLSRGKRTLCLFWSCCSCIGCWRFCWDFPWIQCDWDRDSRVLQRSWLGRGGCVLKLASGATTPAKSCCAGRRNTHSWCWRHCARIWKFCCPFRLGLLRLSCDWVILWRLSRGRGDRCWLSIATPSLFDDCRASLRLHLSLNLVKPHLFLFFRHLCRWFGCNRFRCSLRFSLRCSCLIGLSWSGCLNYSIICELCWCFSFFCHLDSSDWFAAWIYNFSVF